MKTNNIPTVTKSRAVKEESQRTLVNTREIKSQGQLSSRGVHHQTGKTKPRPDLMWQGMKLSSAVSDREL